MTGRTGAAAAGRSEVETAVTATAVVAMVAAKKGQVAVVGWMAAEGRLAEVVVAVAASVGKKDEGDRREQVAAAREAVTKAVVSADTA